MREHVGHGSSPRSESSQHTVSSLHRILSHIDSYELNILLEENFNKLIGFSLLWRIADIFLDWFATLGQVISQW